MKKIISVLIILGLLFCLAACGSDGPDGRYDLVSMEMEGLSYSAEQLAELGLDMEMYVEFDSNGTGVVSVMDEEEDFTWEDNVMVSSAGEINFLLDGDTITMEKDGAKLVFSK